VSDSRYFEDLGTNLGTASKSHLLSRGDLTYRGDFWKILSRVENYQPLGAARPYRRLPQILAHSRRAQRNRQLNFSADAEWVRFDRRTGLTGTRLDLQPGLSFPVRGVSGFFLPRLALRYTAYHLNGTAAGADTTPTRLLPTLDVDSGLFFDRFFDWNGRGFIQTIEPRLYYLRTPFEDQQDLPVFDTGQHGFSFAQLFRNRRFSGADRVGDARQLSLALTSRVLDDGGGELLRASIGQIRYFGERKVTLPGRAVVNTGSSNLVAEAAARFWGTLSLSTDVQWDTHQNRTDQSAVRLRYRPGPGRVINADYRFVHKGTRQTDLSFAWPLHVNWRGVGRWHYATNSNPLLESFVGLEYEGCCWAMRTVVRRYLSGGKGKHTNAVFLQLVLKGLVGTGSSAGNFLQRSIPGYENPF